MLPIRKIINKLYIILRFLRARREVPRLYAQANGVTKTLLKALNSTLRLEVAPDEKIWINKIESLRKELNSSTVIITRIIFGLPPEHQHPQGRQLQNGRLVRETIGQACRRASRQRLWCLLLFKLIREFKPIVCIEMGTSLGITASYQAAALTLNRLGRLITLEGDKTMASLAGKHFQLLGLRNTSVVVGRFQNTLNRVLNEYGPIDYVFVDADKDEKTVLQYFDQIYPFLSRRAMIVFDDIYWSTGMENAWKAIEKDERVKISVDLMAVGICIIGRDLYRKECFKIPIG